MNLAMMVERATQNTWEIVRKWRKYRHAIYNRDNWQCVYCQVGLTDGRLGNATLDHINPRANGELNTPSNLVACCRHCNNRKRDLSLLDFLDFAGMPYDVIYRVNEQRKKPLKES